MNVEPISDRFERAGALIEGAGATLAGIDDAELIGHFERHGIVLLRGFNITPEALTAFANRFTEAYAPDAPRRAKRFEQSMIRNVDAGHGEIYLHSEAAFGATWPEIVWFHCVTPPNVAGETTVCDGVKLWQRLSRSTRERFLAQPVRYDIELQMGDNVPVRNTVTPWPFENVGVSGRIDNRERVIRLSVVRSAVHESRLPEAGPLKRNLAFVNYIICGTSHEEIKNVSMCDGTPIPAEVYDELRQVSGELTHDHRWKTHDLLMIDNRRFMHGRRSFEVGDPRDILQIQSARASFPFGATTRASLGGR